MHPSLPDHLDLISVHVGGKFVHDFVPTSAFTCHFAKIRALKIPSGSFSVSEWVPPDARFQRVCALMGLFSMHQKN